LALNYDRGGNIMDDILLDDILCNMAKEGRFEVSDEIIQRRKQTLSKLPERKPYILRNNLGISAAACILLLIGITCSTFLFVSNGNGQPGKLFSSFVGRITASPKANQLLSPPALTIRSDDKSIQAVRGGCNWTIENTDGTKSGMVVDAAVGPDLLKGSEKLIVKPDSEIQFIFEHEPDSYEIRMWGLSIVQNAVNNRLKVAEDMDSIIYEVIAKWSQGTVYYAFEVTVDKAKSVIPLNFYELTLEQNISVINRNIIKEIFKEKDIEGGRAILFSKTTNPENTYMGFEIGGKLYAVESELMTFNDLTSDLFTIAETEVFGKNLIRISGIMGANYMGSNYFSIEGGKPNLLLSIDGDVTEVDLDGDGIKEIVSSTGTAAFTQIYKYHNGSVVVSDLNRDLGAAAVLLNEDTGKTFDVYYNDSNQPRHYKFNGKEMRQGDA
jgi:hypothetical protein